MEPSEPIPYKIVGWKAGIPIKRYARHVIGNRKVWKAIHRAKRRGPKSEAQKQREGFQARVDAGRARVERMNRMAGRPASNKRGVGSPERTAPYYPAAARRHSSENAESDRD